FNLEPRGDRVVLVPRSRLVVDGASMDLLPQQDLGVAADVRALQIAARVMVPAAGSDPVQIASGGSLTTLRSTSSPQRLPDGAALDCARSDSRTAAEVGITVDVRP